MKKIFTLCVAALLGTTALFAQVDETLQFVDKDGNVVADGSVIDGVAETDAFTGAVQISTGMKVKNTTAESVGAFVEFDVLTMDNGQLNCCYPATCQTVKTTGASTTEKGELPGNDIRPFATEWIPEGSGSASATFQIVLVSISSFNGLPVLGEEIARGPKITVNFNYDATGIQNTVKEQEATVVARYGADGSQLKTAKKGLNIEKLSNGTTRKHIIK